MLPDDQVHPDTHVLTMVNNVIEVVNYVIAARPSLLNSVIADTTAWGLKPSAANYLCLSCYRNGNAIDASATWSKVPGRRDD